MRAASSACCAVGAKLMPSAVNVSSAVDVIVHPYREQAAGSRQQPDAAAFWKLTALRYDCSTAYSSAAYCLFARIALKVFEGRITASALAGSGR